MTDRDRDLAGGSCKEEEDGLEGEAARAGGSRKGTLQDKGGEEEGEGEEEEEEKKKRKERKREKGIAKPLSGKGLVSRIYNESSKLNHKRMSNLILKMSKRDERHFIKIHRWQLST